MYALIEGEGAKVPFPGTKSAWASLYNEASSDIIAKLSIWAALHPEKAGGGQLFNFASMIERWPAVAKYFGLEGIGPADDHVLKTGGYIKKHQHILAEHCSKSVQVFKSEFLDT